MRPQIGSEGRAATGCENRSVIVLMHINTCHWRYARGLFEWGWGGGGSACGTNVFSLHGYSFNKDCKLKLVSAIYICSVPIVCSAVHGGAVRTVR